MEIVVYIMVLYCVLTYIGIGLILLFDDKENDGWDFVFWCISPIIAPVVLGFALKFWYDEEYSNNIGKDKMV